MNEPATFQLVTVDGTTFTKGDTNPFPLGDPAARLEAITSEDGFMALEYPGGPTVLIPEHQIRYVLEIEHEDTGTTV